MPFIVFATVISAALLHATWNAIVKSAGDKFLTTIMVTSAAAGLSAALLPFLTGAGSDKLAIRCCLSAVSNNLFPACGAHISSCRHESSVPLMRGTAPLLVALVTVFRMGDVLSLVAWIGVVAICLGIFSIALGRGSTIARGYTSASERTRHRGLHTDRWNRGKALRSTSGLHTLGISIDRCSAYSLGLDCETVRVCSVR